MKRYLVLILALGLLVACGGRPAPPATVDAVATQLVMNQAAAARKTAAALTATSTPIPTATRGPKRLPTKTLKPEHTPKPKPAKPTTPVTPTTPTPGLAQVGEHTKAGNWLFTVTDVQYHKALYLYDSSRVAMGVYCVLFLDIQNRASGTTHFGELWWRLLGAGGNFYDESATSRAAWQFGGKDTPWTDLNPGQRAEIVMAFDVAEGAKGLQFYSAELKQPFVLIGDAQPPQNQ